MHVIFRKIHSFPTAKIQKRHRSFRFLSSENTNDLAAFLSQIGTCTHGSLLPSRSPLHTLMHLPAYLSVWMCSQESYELCKQ